MKSILAIGYGAEGVVRQFYEGDIDVTVALKKLPQKQFDVVVSYMMLPYTPFRKINTVMDDYVKCVKPGGELILFLPSMEWAAEQILSDAFSPVLPAQIYGDQNTHEGFYASGFTMRDARAHMDNAGIAVTHASRGEYVVRVDGKEYYPEMHILRGVKK